MKASEGKLVIFLISVIVMSVVCSCGGSLSVPLVSNNCGGDSFSTWITTAGGGWPITFIPLAAAYLTRRRTTTTCTSSSFSTITIIIVLTAAALGSILNYLFALAERWVFHTVVILLTLTAGMALQLMAVMRLSVRAAEVLLAAVAWKSKKAYVDAFFMTLAAAVLYGDFWQCIKFWATLSLTHTLVFEFQMVMSLFAAAFVFVGMLPNEDFQLLTKSIDSYGEAKYYEVVVVFTALTWQLYNVGAAVAGAICHGSSLLSAIASLSLTGVLVLIFFHQKFGAKKGISLPFFIWGFVSYFYGEVRNGNSKLDDIEVPLLIA